MNFTNANSGRLSATSLALLKQQGQITVYEDGEVIHQRGDQSPGLSAVLSGAVRVGNYGRDGRYFLSAQLGPGDSFGEQTVFTALPRSHSAEAVGETRISQLGPGQTKALLLEHPKLALDLLGSLAQRLHWSLEALDDSKRLPLMLRTAKLIRYIDQQEEANGQLSVSQEQLAAQIGVSRMSLSKALNKLQSQGLIERRYKTLKIVDRQRLQSWIEANSETLSIS
ncbi:MAG: Crp/Fnr family transcriptional regulator [Cellvibrionaceae bacterium]|nr:Crp/Fnr family transcriptional regulator [Cellvibrionaceae bacterium]MCV6626859.1 Crp/Fnr family transcriptional regulator [Cellvibrionaceae bacterium]